MPAVWENLRVNRHSLVTCSSCCLWENALSSPGQLYCVGVLWWAGQQPVCSCARVLCAVPWCGRVSAFNEIPLILWPQALLVSHLQTALWTSTLIYSFFFLQSSVGRNDTEIITDNSKLFSLARGQSPTQTCWEILLTKSKKLIQHPKGIEVFIYESCIVGTWKGMAYILFRNLLDYALDIFSTTTHQHIYHSVIVNWKTGIQIQCKGK